MDASRAREATLGRFRTLLEAQLGSSHQQMQMFNQRMGQIVRVSGGLILVATLLALLLAWVLNHYFIRSRLVKRFTALNQAVVQIGLAGRMPPFRFMAGMSWGVLPVCFAIRWVSLTRKNSSLNRRLASEKRLRPIFVPPRRADPDR